ncbi:MAG: hypothetical protein JWM14_453 [Chitinophagaceae bacterium]|nr:hypothetical protein [Chitinophagaceae bacterium]
MKKIVFLLLTLSIISCKKKDDSTPTPMISNPVKYDITVTASDGQQYDFIVQSDGRFTCNGNSVDVYNGRFYKEFQFNSIITPGFVFTGGVSVNISAGSGDFTLKIVNHTTTITVYEHSYTNGFDYTFTPSN